MLDFSIILLTYNSDIQKIYNTLNSIISQKKVSYELIISDDGSTDNKFVQIKQFLDNKISSPFKLIENKINQGTIKNILSGINHSQGKYIKLISPGDLFFDENSLYNALEYINKNNDAAVYFGRPLYFTIRNEQVVYNYERKNPYYIKPYLKQNYKSIKRKIFIEDDKILGACTIYNREKILKYLTEISAFNKFAEDYSIIVMLANKEKIKFLNSDNAQFNYFIKYEYGTGISTSKNDKWKIILNNELQNVFNYLYENHYISKFTLLSKTHKNYFLKIFIKILLDPLYILNRKRILRHVKETMNNI